jgi:choice-of-anchor C domain-containing protein
MWFTLTMLIGASPITRANLVINGDFEQPSLPWSQGWALYGAGESFGGWTVGSGQVDLVRLGEVGTGTIESGRQRGLEAWTAASGSQSLDLNGYQPGSIYQDIATMPEATYYLSFAMAGNVVGGPLTVQMSYQVEPGLTGVLDFHVGSHDGYDMGWTYRQFAFVTPALVNQVRLEFASLSDTGARGPALDDVVMDVIARPWIPVVGMPVVVPEPSTLMAGALITLVSLGGEGMRQIRRRRRQVAGRASDS